MTTLTRPVGAFAAATTPEYVVPIDGTRGNTRPMSPERFAESRDDVLKQTVANASTVMTFFKDRFGRDGLDGKGQKLQLVVHAPEPGDAFPMNNAYWDGRTAKMYIGDGDGRAFTPLGLATDIIAHEAGHAILESEVRMGFDGQQGALHESFGDVMGSLIDADDWQIGEDAFTPNKAGDALRDMSKPQRYQHMDEVKSNRIEPHLLADIPNLVAVRVAEKIGREEMGKVWYEGFTSHLKDHGLFSDAASATLKAAEQLFGAGSTQVSAVSDAWTSVGVLKPAS